MSQNECWGNNWEDTERLAGGSIVSVFEYSSNEMTENCIYITLKNTDLVNYYVHMLTNNMFHSSFLVQLSFSVSEYIKITIAAKIGNMLLA